MSDTAFSQVARARYAIFIIIIQDFNYKGIVLAWLLACMCMKVAYVYWSSAVCVCVVGSTIVASSAYEIAL